jgi:hypothetical protein
MTQTTSTCMYIHDIVQLSARVTTPTKSKTNKHVHMYMKIQ